ncbi:MAG: hypothetical protein ABUT20_21550 [Bacteroidota bacterium]
MQRNTPFQFFYYINNLAFSYSLFISLFIAVKLLLILMQKFGMPGISIDTTIDFHLIRGFITVIVIAVALYQSFLALYSIECRSNTFTYWTSKMITCGALFGSAAFLNLIDISTKEKPPFIAMYYKIDGQVIGITDFSLLYFIIAIFFFFISKPKPQEA